MILKIVEASKNKGHEFLRPHKGKGRIYHGGKEENNAVAGGCVVYCRCSSIVCISISAVYFIRQASQMLYAEIIRADICVYSFKFKKQDRRLY